jgi:hypothetical protein
MKNEIIDIAKLKRGEVVTQESLEKFIKTALGIGESCLMPGPLNLTKCDPRRLVMIGTPMMGKSFIRELWEKSSRMDEENRRKQIDCEWVSADKLKKRVKKVMGFR